MTKSRNLRIQALRWSQSVIRVEPLVSEARTLAAVTLRLAAAFLGRSIGRRSKVGLLTVSMPAKLCHFFGHRHSFLLVKSRVIHENCEYCNETIGGTAETLSAFGEAK
jgi:hypothetical protein